MKRWQHTASVAILLLAIIRLVSLDNTRLSYDEKLSVLEANGSPEHVDPMQKSSFVQQNLTTPSPENVLRANIGRDSGNGMAYISVLHIWTRVFGNSNFAVRSLSWLCTLLGAWAVCRLFDVLFSYSANGKWAAFAYLANPLAFQYAAEARGYAMATALMIVSTTVLLKAILKEETRVGDWILYAATATLAVLSHYFAGFILLAHGFICIFYLRNTRAWTGVIASGVAVIVCLSVWMLCGGWEGWKLMSLRNESYIALSKNDQDNVYYKAASLASIAGGWAQGILVLTGNFLQAWGLQIRVILIAVLVPVTASFLFLRDKIDRHKKIMLLVLMVTYPVVSTFLSIKSGHIISFSILYFNFTVPYFAVFLVAACASLCRQRLLFYSVVVVQCLIMMISDVAVIQGYAHSAEPDYPQVAGMFLKENDREHFEVVYHSWEDAKLANLYFADQAMQQRVEPSDWKSIEVYDVKTREKIRSFAE